MTITAGQVKELRALTGAGMMECKKALAEVAGDVQAAIELMRKKGQAKAAKKSTRIAAEGAILVATSDDGKTAAIVEVNCETDFVARGDEFNGFAKQVAQAVLSSCTTDVEALSQKPLVAGEAKTIEEERQTLISAIGENIKIRRAACVKTDGQMGAYIHGGRIGVIVDLAGTDIELAKDIAMHVAASKPEVVKPEDVSEELVNKEKEIFSAQALESGKPAEIVEKMVTGRIRKYLGEISLYGQSFVKDMNKTVEQLLKETGSSVNSFVRYEVGEGIEKKVDNFVEEVKAQARGE